MAVEEIKVEIGADATRYTSATKQAQKDAKDFGDEWERTAKKQQTAADKMGRSQMSLAREGQGLARSLSDLARGSGDLQSKMGALSFDAAQFGNALQAGGGKAGAFGAALESVAGKATLVTAALKTGWEVGSWLNSFDVVSNAADDWVDGLAKKLQLTGDLFGVHSQALDDMVAANNRVAKSTEDWTTNLGQLNHELAAQAANLAAVTGATGGTERGGGTVPTGPASQTSKTGKRLAVEGSAEAAEQHAKALERSKASSESYAQKQQQLTEAWIRNTEAIEKNILAYEDRRTTVLAQVGAMDREITKMHETAAAEAEKQAAADAAAKDAATNARLDAAFGPSGDVAPEDDPRRQQAKANAEKAQADFAAKAGTEQGGFGFNLGMAMFGEDDQFGDRTIEATNNMAVALVTVADAAAQAGEAIARMAIGKVMDAAIGPSLRYVHANKEAAKAAKAMQLSTSESIKVGMRDILKGIATEAAIKSALSFAEAIFPPNPALAAKGAALAAVAAAAGIAAAAIGPVTKKIPDAAKPKADEARGGGVGLGAKEGGVGEVVNITVNVMPGTDENRIGEAMERSINRARRERGRTELR